MVKTLHILLHKKHCRIQIFFGLCLAMLFTFFTPSIRSLASYPYTTWGAFDGSGDPVQMFDNNINITLDHMIELSFYQTVIDSTELTNFNVSYNGFASSINHFGLQSILSNWQAGNPRYYLNIAYVSYQSRHFYALYYSKFNGKFTYNPSVNDNNSIALNNNAPVFYSLYLDQFLPDYSYLSTSNGVSSQYAYAKSLLIRNQLADGITENGSFYCNGIQVPYFFNLNCNAQNIIDRFSYFLNNADCYIYTVLIPDYLNDTTSSLKYGVNTSILSNGTKYPIFSMIYSYDYYAQDVSVAYDSYSYFYWFLPSLNRFSTGIVLQDTSDIFSYGYQYGGTSGVNTPTPIPTYSWNTPTPIPIPTYLINATLTPIILPADPNISSSYGDPVSYIVAMINLVGDVLSSNVVSFFSTVVQFIYNSSYFFQILMFVIPAIILIAFVVGRLKKK